MRTTLDIFRNAGESMQVATDQLDEALRAADVDNNRRVDGPVEFGALYELLERMSDEHYAHATGLIRQAAAGDGAGEPALGRNQSLSEVPVLQGVWHGVGSVGPTAGVTLGTRSIQSALKELAGRSSRFAASATESDGRYGPGTSRAVSRFQSVAGLPETGIVDRETLRKLDAELRTVRQAPVNDIRRVQPGDLRGIYYGDQARLPPRTIAVTLDDGPDPDTLNMLAMLREADVKGVTFFVLGQNVKRYPEIVRQAVADGHVIGVHTWDHPDLSKLREEQIKDQIVRTVGAIRDVLGPDYPIKEMRPPYGATNALVKQVLGELGLDLILWTHDPLDWKAQANRNPNLIHDSLFAGPNKIDGAGVVLLGHDIHPVTTDEFKKVIARVKEMGYRFTTVASMLDAKYGNVA